MASPQRRTENGKTQRQTTTSNDGFFSLHQIFGEDTFPHQRLVLLGLGVLNVVLLIIAVVIGVNCANAGENSLDAHASSAFPLFKELQYLRSNHSDVVQAEEEAQKALQSEMDDHAKVKEQIELQRGANDKYQVIIEALQVEREQLRVNKSAIGLSCGKCQSGWILMNMSCYFFSTTDNSIKKSWQASRDDCINRGSDLVVIEDIGEQSFVVDNLQSVSGNDHYDRAFWIGLTDMVEEGKWVYVNNVTATRSMFWMDREPNNLGPTGENCVAVTYISGGPRSSNPTNSWFDSQCQRERNWICETKST
ncbi:uncharacterized protein LOC143009546 [Genypterus blacodes]|uniref:uncharacterized protein LOC143009546 n=1 Tax=Genypterus blacodes TaxID=154954 RepID=UPI003F762021